MIRSRSSEALFLNRFKSAKFPFARIKHLPLYIFFRELLSNPRNIGAACPSSKKLADGIASFVPVFDDGYVVELGAGTGVVTAALLKRGVDPNKLIVIEKSAHLAKLLMKKFPHIKIIKGDAVLLENLLYGYLNLHYAQIATIVSSLPLRSMPESTVDRISKQMEQLVMVNGKLIQFTYDIRSSRTQEFESFKSSRSKIIWLNIPPARINIYRKTAAPIL